MVKEEIVSIKEGHWGFKVYKLVDGEWHLKGRFFSRHKANRYIRGFEVDGIKVKKIKFDNRTKAKETL